MPKVIHKWTQRSSNLVAKNGANTWGLGDLIRGSVSLSEVAIELGYDFEMDIGSHPISNYLELYENRNENLLEIDEVKFISFKSSIDMIDFLKKELHQKKEICFNTNGFEKWPDNVSIQTIDIVNDLPKVNFE